MDRALDEIVAERQRPGGGGRSRGGRRGGPRQGGRERERTEYPRDGLTQASSFAQSTREDNRNIDSEWVHDKFDNDSTESQYHPMKLALMDSLAGRRPVRAERRFTPEAQYDAPSSKLRVENLHYDLTEEDLEDLFNRIGPVLKLSLTYDRAGRSEGVAYVTYESAQDAKAAVREFDGANAKGQPIRLISIPSGPAVGRRGPPPSRSLFDRITPAHRSRSDSPIRHSDVTGPAPSNVDRYVPGGTRSRSRSPRPRRREGRRPGARREGGERRGGGEGRRGGGAGNGDRLARDGRPRKTQEELDAEMEDYWGQKDGGAANGAEAPATEAAAINGDDIDMIE
ncbi:related to RNA and export factor binding protein [Rhynchosporium graminicola]|uniref:Related to RNA and export factor binding protein n=1 Tax=Rhynchosporium graminicola TaxID=2792576 RepID=A0A1E1LH33_9HELO|nr:related to RNA and export factor binding protein [Rhynchosporium commune]